MLESIPKHTRSELSHDGFLKTYFQPKLPVVLKGEAKEWRAVQKWSPDYFSQLFPEKNIKIFLFQQTNGKWERSCLEGITMADAISLMQENRDPHRKYYILKDGIYKNYPELIQDFSFPTWVQVPDSQYANLWFGEGGNTTALHFDTVENFLVQIYGRKQIRLFSPQDTPYLYPHNIQTGGRLNFSRIYDLQADLSDSFPLFIHAKGLPVVLEPGDMLYLPPGWWHEVRTLDLGISLNFWFNPRKDKGPLWHILGYTACRLEEGLLSPEETHALYSCTWANALETAEFMREKGHVWLAALICGACLESYSEVPLGFLDLMQKASWEDNSLISDEQIQGAIDYVQSYSLQVV